MPIPPKRAAHRRFIAPEEGARYPAFDLSGRQQRVQELHQLLNGTNEALSMGVTRELRDLLSCDSLRAVSQGWGTTAPETPDFQLSAFTPEQSDQPVLLGLDRRSLFSLSELFFGGQPQKLTEKQIGTRSVTDTERRFCNRLLNLILKLVCPPLNLPLTDWQSHWLDAAAVLPTDTFWCPVTVSGGDWSVVFYYGWPTAKMSAPVALPRANEREFKLRLERKLKRVTTTLKVEVATLHLNLAALGELTVGEILPLNLNGEINVRAGESDCLRGLVCEDGDRLALRITTVVGDH